MSNGDEEYTCRHCGIVDETHGDDVSNGVCESCWYSMRFEPCTWEARMRALGRPVETTALARIEPGYGRWVEGNPDALVPVTLADGTPAWQVPEPVLHEVTIKVDGERLPPGCIGRAVADSKPVRRDGTLLEVIGEVLDDGTFAPANTDSQTVKGSTR